MFVFQEIWKLRISLFFHTKQRTRASDYPLYIDCQCRKAFLYAGTTLTSNHPPWADYWSIKFFVQRPHPRDKFFWQNPHSRGNIWRKLCSFLINLWSDIINFTTFNIVSCKFHPFYSSESKYWVILLVLRVVLGILGQPLYCKLLIRTNYKRTTPWQNSSQKPHPRQGKLAKTRGVPGTEDGYQSSDTWITTDCSDNFQNNKKEVVHVIAFIVKRCWFWIKVS